MELGGFVRDSVPLSFNQHSSPIILDMTRSMSYMPSLGVGHHQHSRGEFISVLDHDPPFGLGFIPSETNFLCMAQLYKDESNLDFITFHLTILFVLTVWVV